MILSDIFSFDCAMLGKRAFPTRLISYTARIRRDGERGDRSKIKVLTRHRRGWIDSFLSRGTRDHGAPATWFHERKTVARVANILHVIPESPPDPPVTLNR